MKRRSVLFGVGGVGAALLLLAVVVPCSRPARAQTDLSPAYAPAPGSVPAAPQKQLEAEAIDGLLKRLEDIKAQKAELDRQKARLDKAEVETAELLAARFRQLKERLHKAGVAVEPVYNQGTTLPPAPVVPATSN